MEARCRLCGEDRLRPLYRNLHKIIGCRFARCSVCSLIQVIPGRPDAEEHAFYEQRYYQLPHKQQEFTSRLSLFDDLLGRIERRTAGRTLLDVGTGRGEFVAAAARRGWQAEGLDISEKAVREGISAYGVTLHCGDLETWDCAGRAYDAVTFWNVIDQIPDPALAARRAHSLLREGGLIAIRVPNGSFHHAFRMAAAGAPALVRPLRLYDYFSVHLFSFTPRTLARLLLATGFTGVEVLNAPPSKGDPAGHLQGIRLKTLSAAKRAAFGAAEALRGVSLGRCLVAPSILAVARRAPGA